MKLTTLAEDGARAHPQARQRGAQEPMTQANSPSATLNHRSSNTVSWPLPGVSGNRRVKPCALMNAVLVGIGHQPLQLAAY